MKKFYIIFTSFLSLSLCACGSVTPSVTTEETETPEVVKDFGTILDNYCLAYTENWSHTKMRQEQVSCFQLQEEGASIDDYGFTIMDVNGDGCNDLVIGRLEDGAKDPVCSVYYDMDGFCDAYGVSYTDDFTDPDGMDPSYVQYYLTLNEDSGVYDLLKVTPYPDTEGLPEDHGIYYSYELDQIAGDCMSMQMELIPEKVLADGSVGWTLNVEATPAGSSEEAMDVTDLTEKEAESRINKWMEQALVPEYHPLTEWVENPVLNDYLEE